MSALPCVSIGLPVYNGEKHLAKTMESLLGQDYGDFELIISDNASTDATQEICQSFVRQDCRIRYYRNGINLGAAVNYNRVFELAVGRYFKWAPHDDLYAPDYLRVCVEALEQAEPGVVLAYPQTLLIDEQGTVLGLHEDGLDTRGLKAADRLGRMLSDDSSWCHAVLGLVRSDVLRTTRLIGSYGGSDQTLLAELALRGEFCEVARPLFMRRVYDGQSPSLQANRTAEEVAAWFDARNHDRIACPWTRLLWEHMRAIRLAPILWREKLACMRLLKTSPFAVLWSRERVSQEIRRAVRESGARYAMRAIRRGHGYYLPHRMWALWNGIKYRKWKWIELAFSLPCAASRTALLEFVATRLYQRTDRASYELLNEWLYCQRDECRSAATLAASRNTVA